MFSKIKNNNIFLKNINAKIIYILKIMYNEKKNKKDDSEEKRLRIKKEYSSRFF